MCGYLDVEVWCSYDMLIPLADECACTFFRVRSGWGIEVYATCLRLYEGDELHNMHEQHARIEVSQASCMTLTVSVDRMSVSRFCLGEDMSA